MRTRRDTPEVVFAYGRDGRRLILAAFTAVAVLATSAAAPVLAAHGPAVKITLTEVSVSGGHLTIAGRASISGAPPKGRRAEVLFMLTGAGGVERFSARLGVHGRFKDSHASRLTGSLRLRASLLLGGRVFGRAVLKTLHVAPPTGPVSIQPPAGPGSKRSGPPAGGTGGGPVQPTAAQLNGIFKLTPATDAGAVIKGSWFEMLDPEEGGIRKPLPNGNSPLANQDYTPVSPGTSGGLSTSAFQPAPSPAFSEVIAGKERGNAIANAIMQPQSFFGFNFSVVSEATDRQTAEADPIPSIVDTGGHLSGQVTAWSVGWNGEWFNQGSPKPNGSLPNGTTAVSGTYDASTGAYVLEWRSLIVKGPFNGFLGAWHLEGTYVPAG